MKESLATGMNALLAIALTAHGAGYLPIYRLEQKQQQPSSANSSIRSI